MAALCALPLPTRASVAGAGPFSKPLKLGNLELRSGLILSPMEGVSCVGFRRLCYESGAVGLTWTEMVRAAGLQRNNGATFDLVDTFDADVPTGLQLMARARRTLPPPPRPLSRTRSRAHPHPPLAHRPWSLPHAAEPACSFISFSRHAQPTTGILSHAHPPARPPLPAAHPGQVARRAPRGPGAARAAGRG